MKTALISGLIVLTSFVSMSANAHNSNAHNSVKRIVTSDSTAESSFCAAILKDKPLLINERLKEIRSTKERAINTIRCNGLSVTEFASKHNATKAIASLGLSDNQNQIASTKF